MASAKHTFGAGSFAAGSFACGAWRGVGADAPDPEPEPEVASSAGGGGGGMGSDRASRTAPPARKPARPVPWPEKPKWRPFQPPRPALVRHDGKVRLTASAEASTRLVPAPLLDLRHDGQAEVELRAGAIVASVHGCVSQIGLELAAGGDVVTVDGLQLRLRIMMEDYFILGQHTDLAGDDELLGLVQRMIEDQLLLGV